jgi:hypothetical protein
MLHKDLVLHKFENGFRILSEKDLDDKFFVIDEVNLEIGATYQVGPNGYFEYKGNPVADLEALVKTNAVA